MANNKLQEELTLLLEVYTEHLNTLSLLSEQMKSVQEFVLKSAPDIDLTTDLKLSTQLNLNGLLTGAMLDLLVVTKHLYESKKIWEEIYFLKHGYLIIYEVFNTYNKFNKKIAFLIAEKLSECKVLYNEIAEEIKAYKKKFSLSNIGTVRNKLAGHYHENFTEYFEMLSIFDREKAKAAIQDFVWILAKMLKLSSDILASSNNLTPRGDILQKEIIAKMNQHFSEISQNGN